MKKILILGCNGMAGHIISLYLESQGYSFDKLARSEKHFEDTILADVSDFESIKQIIINQYSG
jgi:dTDP-4-dehydrorhamnose reductase